MLTDRVKTSLGGTYTGMLRDLTALGMPEDPDSVTWRATAVGSSSSQGRDWLADAFMAVLRLFTRPGTTPQLANLRDAADGFRPRIVGTVLREVDDCCVM